MGNVNINMLRVSTRIREIYDGLIDMGDYPNDNAQHFETRALAALVLSMKTGIDVQQSCLHITDGYKDAGIDAVYLDEVQKKLFVLQSKWRNDGSGAIDKDEMSTFVEGLKRILNFDLDGVNKKLEAKKADIEHALTQIGYQVSAIFVHTGSTLADQFVLRPINELLKTTNDEISTILVFEELSFKDIYSYLAKGQDQDNIDIDDVILTNWGKIETPYVAYYGTISAATVGEWYKKYGNALFVRNIRFYKGKTDVNEGIKRTLLQEPEKFFYLNNGIKLLCKSIKRKAKDSTTNATGLFSLEGVSLVNGAQTAGTVGEVFKEKPEQTTKASILIQIIDLSNVEEESAKQITKHSNTQNRIENKDYVALDKEQERLRIDLSFAHYAYLYKSGDKVTDTNSQISFDEAVVALACGYKDIAYSTLAKGNVGALSEDIEKTPYKALINPSTNAFILLNGVLVLREIDKYLLEKKEETTGRERLVCVHGNRFIAHCVLQNINNIDDYSTVVMEQEKIAMLVKDGIDKYLPLITSAMNLLYQDSYPANIFKNNTKCKCIKEEVLKHI